MREYFRNIYLTVKTILIGMRITLKYCFARTITVQYPDVAPTIQPRFRGFHYFEIEKCIGCDLCAKACPVDCIYIEKTGPRKIDKETGVALGGAIVRYAIDYSKCMFCALCTEPCPTECIHMGNNHDLSGYDRESMVVVIDGHQRPEHHHPCDAGSADGLAGTVGRVGAAATGSIHPAMVRWPKQEQGKTCSRKRRRLVEDLGTCQVRRPRAWPAAGRVCRWRR